MIRLLPAQLYSPLLSKLEENMFTMGCQEAVMVNRGDKARMKTIAQVSASISQEKHLIKEQTDDEFKRKVNVNVLPLQDIYPFDSGKEVF